MKGAQGGSIVCEGLEGAPRPTASSAPDRLDSK